MNTLESLLPQDVVRFIHSQHIDLNMEDSPSWRYNASGAFSTRSAYMSLTKNGNGQWKWKNLWKLKVPQRSRMFMWLLCSESVLTNVEKNKRGMTDVMECGSCKGIPEDVLHVVRECKKAAEVWRIIVPVND